MAFWLLFFAAQAGIVDRVAGVVDGEVIALSEVYDLGGTYVNESCPAMDGTCVVEAELEILDTLIKWALVRQELGRLDMGIGGTDVDQAIDSIIKDYDLEDRAALRAEVEKSGTRWEAYREQLRDQLEAQRFRQVVIAPRVTVSDDEVLDIYQRTARRERRLQVTFDALGIQIDTDATDEQVAEMITAAADLVGSINGGELDWATAVKDYDAAGLSKIVSGRPYDRGELTPQVEEELFNEEIPLNEVLAPIRVGNVLFVVKPLSREVGEGDILPLEEVEVQLRNQLFEGKLAEAEEEWYQRARRESAVEVKLTE